jgi:hypothetical protein
MQRNVVLNDICLEIELLRQEILLSRNFVIGGKSTCIVMGPKNINNLYAKM